MLGWMILFAILALVAGILTIAAGPAAAMLSTRLATLLFSALFLICVVTSLVRGRA
jgi:uncharacterized membrane protein YtjA (UPF0391 family)